MAELLYTLAYPDLAEADRVWIENFRRQHDLPFRDVVAAHVTLAFGHGKLAPGAYFDHVAEVASASAPVDFVCRYAMQGVDDGDGRGYVFLVPDEGFSVVSLLRDRLHRGPLTLALRLDIPFVPHITIGTLPSHRAARDLCDALNERGIDIAGRIDALTVSALRDGKIADLARFPLGAPVT